MRKKLFHCALLNDAQAAWHLPTTGGQSVEGSLLEIRLNAMLKFDLVSLDDSRKKSSSGNHRKKRKAPMYRMELTAASIKRPSVQWAQTCQAKQIPKPNRSTSIATCKP